jgi:hypothetical protein
MRVASSRENRRSALRYALRAEVVVSWANNDGGAQESCGLTRDISPGGAYVFTPTPPPVGQKVQMSIYLPVIAGETHEPSVHVRARVLRVDSSEGASETGFAVRNEKVTLCAP